MAWPLACGKQPIAFAHMQGLAVGQEGRGQEVEQALIEGRGVHVIQII
jgi:hypothetical protein